MFFKKIFALVLMAIFFVNIQAQGNGLTNKYQFSNIKSAWNLSQGYLTLSARSQVFGKVARLSANNIARPTFALWDIQGALAINYGLNRFFELSFSPILYQDTNSGKKEYLIPGDIFLGLKLSSCQISNSLLACGLSFNARLPIGKQHNLPLEPYSAGTFEWGFSGMLSISSDPIAPDQATNIDINVGYLNHNDVGEKLSTSNNDNFWVTSINQQLLYGLGIKIPSDKFDFAFEIYGNYFLQAPPIQTAYSLENYIYLTPGISYKAQRWLTFNVGFDFRVSPDYDETIYYFISKLPANIPNYPSWRINIGLAMLLLPSTVHQLSDRDVLIERSKNRTRLFEQITNEMQETEEAEQILQELKEERNKVEKELEKLKRLLEEDTTKKKEENQKKKK
jgi:hypothetical protein